MHIGARWEGLPGMGRALPWTLTEGVPLQGASAPKSLNLLTRRLPPWAWGLGPLRLNPPAHLESCLQT